jgi:hypothetical protein
MSNPKYELKELAIQDNDIHSKLLDQAPEIIDEYLCHICLYLVKEPVACSNCEEIMCSKCIQQNLKHSNKCPKCKSIFSEKAVPRKVKSILDSLTMKCPNNNKNCKIRTKYPFSINEHLNICPYTDRIAICKGCRAEIKTTNKLIEIDEHIKTCEDVDINCPTCDSLVKRYLVKEECSTTNVSKAYEDINQINNSERLKEQCEIEREIYVNQRIQEFVKKFNNVFREVTITEKFENDRFKDLLDLGVKKLILNNYPVDLPRMLALRNNNSIQHLNLENSSLSDDHALVLASILEQNGMLKVLDLSNNLLRYKGADAIINSLIKNKSLECLYLSKNILDTSGFMMNFFNKIFKKKTSEINFGQSLYKLLENNTVLQELYLDGCGLIHEDVTQLCLGLHSNMSIANLALAGNKISKENLALLKDLVCRRRFLKLDIEIFY